MPVHVVTFLLTEVPDSVRRWEEDEAAMTAVTEQLDATVADLVGKHAGTQVKPRGEGDSHFLVFDDPVDAVRCAVALQRSVVAETGLLIRSACHTGEAESRNGDWYGTTVNRCARLRAAAHGGQALVSAEVAGALAALTTPPEGISLRSLGRHRLKDLDELTEIFQVCAEGLVDGHPPLATLAQTHGLTLPRSTFVGRSADCAYALRQLADGAVVAVAGAPGVGTTRFAMETAARWWDTARGRVRVFDAPGELDGRPTRASPEELVVMPDAEATMTTTDVTGPAIVVTRDPSAVPADAVVRLSPLDSFEAELLLKERVGDDAHVPDGLAGWCDGLPLAIELLARRAASIDGSVLAQRLAVDPLAVLGGDRHADPPRHASVRAAFAAAFDALDEQQQADLLAAAPGDPRWVAAGWHEPNGPLPLVAAFLTGVQRTA